MVQDYLHTSFCLDSYSSFSSVYFLLLRVEYLNQVLFYALYLNLYYIFLLVILKLFNLIHIIYFNIYNYRWTLMLYKLRLYYNSGCLSIFTQDSLKMWLFSKRFVYFKILPQVNIINYYPIISTTTQWLIFPSLPVKILLIAYF